MTILVCFLLMVFSANGQLLQAQKGLAAVKDYHDIARGGTRRDEDRAIRLHHGDRGLAPAAAGSPGLAGASEQHYINKADAPMVKFIKRDEISDFDRAYTES